MRMIEARDLIVLLLLLLIVCAALVIPASAQTITICYSGQYAFVADRALPGCVILCPYNTRSAGCTPPVLPDVDPRAAIPFNLPVKVGQVISVAGGPRWVMIRAGSLPRSCTPEELSRGEAHRTACNARMGDPVWVSVPYERVR